MDPTTFDRIAQRLVAAASRRRIVRGAFTLATGSALVALGQASAAADEVSAENCTPAGKRCGKGKRQQPCNKCCTKNVITDQKGRKRCSCVRPGNGCSNDSQCCEGICTSGTCRVSDPVSCTGVKPTATSDTQGLQEAIDAADAGGTLALCAGTWHLTHTPVIDKNLTLIGAGAGATILDGGHVVKVLQVNAGATVTLQDLTITKGRGISGAGIYNQGDLTLQSGTSVTGNFGVNGGGILHKLGTLTLKEGSSVMGNSASVRGGGIFTESGTVTLEGEDPSSIVVNNCRDNCAGLAGLVVAKCAATPIACP